jgi:hypothetical protein
MKANAPAPQQSQTQAPQAHAISVASNSKKAVSSSSDWTMWRCPFLCPATIQRPPSDVPVLQYSHVQPAAMSLSAMVSQYFTGGIMPNLVSPVQTRHDHHRDSPPTERVGSVLKRLACSRTGLARPQKRMLSVAQRLGQNSVAERFVCSTQIGQLSARFPSTESKTQCRNNADRVSQWFKLVMPYSPACSSPPMTRERH